MFVPEKGEGRKIIILVTSSAPATGLPPLSWELGDGGLPWGLNFGADSGRVAGLG